MAPFLCPVQCFSSWKVTLRQKKPFAARIFTKVMEKTPCHFSVGDAVHQNIILTGCHYHPKKPLDTVSPWKISCQNKKDHIISHIYWLHCPANYLWLITRYFLLLNFAFFNSLLPKTDNLVQLYFTRFICTQCVFPQVTLIIISRYTRPQNKYTTTTVTQYFRSKQIILIPFL